MKQKKFTQPKNILTYNTQLYVTSEIFDFWKDILTEQHDYVNYIIKYILENNKDGQRVGCRYYSKSGLIYDADWNAAINIKNRFEHPISKEMDNNIIPLHYLIGRVSSITQMFNDGKTSLEQTINL